MDKRILGWVLSIAGALGCIYSTIVISNDMTPSGLFGTRGYTYEPPLTPHESSMVFLVIASAVALAAGIIVLLRENYNS